MGGAKILLVDDERSVWKTLERTLEGKSHQLFMADNSEQAMAILAEEQMDVVLSDIRLPGMDGHQLLRQVKQLYPTITRLILSGYADEKEALRTILDGSAKMYIFKPWDNRVLLKSLEQILHFRSLLQSKQLYALMNRVEKLDTPPTIYDELTALMEGGASIKTIAETVESEPAITAKILQVANSAYFGVKTGSVQQAVVFLGLSAVKNIILSAHVFNFAGATAEVRFAHEVLYEHACMSNRIVGGIYERFLRRKLPDISSSAGLLHNIGQAVLLKQCDHGVASLQGKNSRCPGLFFQEKSQELFGVDSSEVGGYLLNWWDLPQPLVEAALFYQEPLREEVLDRELVCAVHIADHLAWQRLACGAEEEISPEILAEVGMSHEDVTFLEDLYSS